MKAFILLIYSILLVLGGTNFFLKIKLLKIIEKLKYNIPLLFFF